MNTPEKHTPTLTEQFLSLNWHLGDKAQDKIKDLDKAREMATELAQVVTHNNDPDRLILTGTLYRYLQEPVLASSCFWWVDQAFFTKGGLRISYLSQILLANWWIDQKHFSNAVELLSNSVQETSFQNELEQMRLASLGRAHLAMKSAEKALQIGIEHGVPSLLKFLSKNFPKLFLIEDAKVSELTELTELAVRSKSHWNYHPEYITSYRKYFTLTPETSARLRIRTVKANLNGSPSKPLGWSGFILEEPYLEHLWIDPKYIGSGLGSLLWSDLIKFAKKSKVTTFQLMSDPYAVPFYEKLGCQDLGPMPSRIENGPTHQKMEWR